MSKLTYFAGLAVIGIVMAAGSTFAQDNGDNNGDNNGDRSRRRGNWDPSEYLQRLDANKNGQMDPGELRGRLVEYVQELGFTTDQPILISDIVNRATGREKKSSSNNQTQSQKREFVRKVPGFGVEAAEIDPVRNFSADGSISNPEILARKYGESLMSEVERTLERYDGNRDGKLNADEIRNGNWGRPSPDESDLNKDGELSRFELAERYKQRYSAQNEDRDSRRDRGSRRNDDSRDRNWRDNGRNSGRDSGRDRGRGDSSRESSRGDSGDSSDARARARAAAERASRDREREERMKEDVRRRDDSRDSAARARAKAAAEAARRQRESSGESGDDRGSNRNEDNDEDRDKTVRAYAQKMMDKYDKNRDKVLDKDEMESFRRPPENHDPNEDGEVTYDELYQAYKNRNSNSGSSSSESSSRRSSSDRGRSSSSRSRSSSGGTDKDGDGKIKMAEFADEWTQEKIEEFQRLDVNNDGYLSREEFSKR